MRSPRNQVDLFVEVVVRVASLVLENCGECCRDPIRLFVRVFDAIAEFRRIHDRLIWCNSTLPSTLSAGPVAWTSICTFLRGFERGGASVIFFIKQGLQMFFIYRASELALV